MLAKPQLRSMVRKLIRILDALMLTVILAGCNPCGNQIGYEQQSPGGKLKAVAFERDCGATTGFTTQISILPSNQELPNEVGNLFIADGDLKIRMKWETEDKLVITYPRDAKVGLKRATQSGISVRYETAP
jgi:hypothetical protein